MERVDQMTSPPIVGKTYWVPTVNYLFYGRPGVFPVLGPKHEDREHIGFPEQHFHMDWRFAPEWALKRCDSRFFFVPLNTRGHELPPVVNRRRLCRREVRDNFDCQVSKGFQALHRAWAGRDAHLGPHGFICPHRGTPLGSLKRDTFELSRTRFMDLMYQVRGFNLKPQFDRANHERFVKREIALAVQRLKALTQRYAPSVTRLEKADA